MMEQVSLSARDFSDHLSRLVVPPDHSGNALVSPLSLLTVLSLLLAGTRNRSNSQLREALHMPSQVNQSVIDDYYNALLTSFEAKMNQTVQEEYREVILVENMALVSD